MTSRTHDWSLPYVGAHKHSSAHRQEIEASAICGCFYCLSTFAPGAIEEWTDEPDKKSATAICPRCGVDSVIGSGAEFPLTKDFLRTMKLYWFGP